MERIIGKNSQQRKIKLINSQKNREYGLKTCRESKQNRNENNKSRYLEKQSKEMIEYTKAH